MALQDPQPQVSVSEAPCLASTQPGAGEILFKVLPGRAWERNEGPVKEDRTAVVTETLGLRAEDSPEGRDKRRWL